MGLTHSWERPTEFSEESFKYAVADIRKVLAEIDVKIGGLDGTGLAIFREDYVLFNGASPKACEPFEIRRIEFDRRGRSRFWSSCKTGLLPYDHCVRVALIVLKHRLGSQIKVASDDKTDNWAAACDECQKILLYGLDFSLES